MTPFENTCLTSPGRRQALFAACVVARLLWPVAARADPPPPLQVGDRYQIDLFQGPVLGSTRVVGLGGAFAAVAEEAVGIPYNPAAVAHRTYYSVDRFDWDLGFDFLIPGLFQSDDFDFDNNGQATGGDFWVTHLGGQIQVGAFGVGAYWQSQGQKVTFGSASSREYNLGLHLIQLSAGYSFFSHQLVIGGGLRVGLFQVQEKGKAEVLFKQQAVGGEAGVIYRPRSLPLRFAAVFNSTLESTTPKECSADQCPQGFVMPTGVALPWSVRFGAAYRFGDTPFNRIPPFMNRPSAGAPKSSSGPTSLPAGSPGSTSAPASLHATPHGEPDLDRDYRGGFYVLVSVEVDLTGSVDDAIGMDGLVGQLRERSGRSLSFSPRLGVETELLRRRLRLRAGTYYEPSRFEAWAGRMHGTFAVDLRLFDFSAWGRRSLRVAAALDLAARYSNLCLSLGFWH